MHNPQPLQILVYLLLLNILQGMCVLGHPFMSAAWYICGLGLYVPYITNVVPLLSGADPYASSWDIYFFSSVVPCSVDFLDALLWSCIGHFSLRLFLCFCVGWCLLGSSLLIDHSYCLLFYWFFMFLFSFLLLFMFYDLIRFLFVLFLLIFWWMDIFGLFGFTPAMNSSIAWSYLESFSES